MPELGIVTVLATACPMKIWVLGDEGVITTSTEPMLTEGATEATAVVKVLSAFVRAVDSKSMLACNVEVALDLAVISLFILEVKELSVADLDETSAFKLEVRVESLKTLDEISDDKPDCKVESLLTLADVSELMLDCKVESASVLDDDSLVAPSNTTCPLAWTNLFKDMVSP